jgi:hypothetical protein
MIDNFSLRFEIGIKIDLSRGWLKCNFIKINKTFLKSESHCLNITVKIF